MSKPIQPDAVDVQAAEIIEKLWGTPLNSPIYQTAGRTIEATRDAIATALRTATAEGLAQAAELLRQETVEAELQMSEAERQDLAWAHLRQLMENCATAILAASPIPNFRESIRTAERKRIEDGVKAIKVDVLIFGKPSVKDAFTKFLDDIYAALQKDDAND